MTTAAKAVGMHQKRLTNHSARKTQIQHLVDNEFAPSVVAQLSGHKNLKSLDSYMTASKKQQKAMSLTLSRNRDTLTEESTPNPALKDILNLIPTSHRKDDKAVTYPRAEDSTLFAGNILSGCTINISVDACSDNRQASYSQTVTTYPPQKRCAAIIDSETKSD